MEEALEIPSRERSEPRNKNGVLLRIGPSATTNRVISLSPTRIEKDHGKERAAKQAEILGFFE